MITKMNCSYIFIFANVFENNVMQYFFFNNNKKY